MGTTLRAFVTGTMIVTSAACLGPGNLEPTSLPPAVQAISVYQGGMQPKCAYDQLGIIEATSGSAMSMGTYESTVARLKQKAGALGADGLIVTDHFKNGMADQATAFAIRCKPDTAATSGSSAP